MHTKRCRCAYLMISWGQLYESCLSVDQDNIVEVKRKFEEIRLNRMKRDLTKTTVPSYYSPDMLVCKDAAEEQIELLERFVLTNDAHSKRRILFQLVPATMDEYVDAFLNGKPYPTDPIIDKLMDTEDWKTRKKLVENAGINISDVILRDFLICRCVRMSGRRYSFMELTWNIRAHPIEEMHIRSHGMN